MPKARFDPNRHSFQACIRRIEQAIKAARLRTALIFQQFATSLNTEYTPGPISMPDSAILRWATLSIGIALIAPLSAYTQVKSSPSTAGKSVVLLSDLSKDRAS